MAEADLDREIGGLHRRRSELQREQQDIDAYFKRMAEPLQSLSVVLREGLEIQVYENVIGITEGEKDRVEDVNYEGRSLRERVIQFRSNNEELREIRSRLGELGVD